MAPSAPSIFDRIEEAIAVRLARISGDDRYRTAVVAVKRDLYWIDQYETELEAGAVLGVVRGSGSNVRLGRERSADAYQHRVHIWGYVQSVPGVPVAPKLWNLVDDVLNCLLEDETLAGQVMDLRPDPDGGIDTDDGAIEAQAYFRWPWLARA